MRARWGSAPGRDEARVSDSKYLRNVLPFLIDRAWGEVETMDLPGRRLLAFNDWGEAVPADR